MYQLPSQLGDWSYNKEIPLQYYAQTEMSTDECTDDQACELFAFTDGAVTWSLLVFPLEKQGKILRK